MRTREIRSRVQAEGRGRVELQVPKSTSRQVCRISCLIIIPFTEIRKYADIWDAFDAESGTLPGCMYYQQPEPGCDRILEACPLGEHF